MSKHWCYKRWTCNGLENITVKSFRRQIIQSVSKRQEQIWKVVEPNVYEEWVSSHGTFHLLYCLISNFIVAKCNTENLISSSISVLFLSLLLLSFVLNLVFKLPLLIFNYLLFKIFIFLLLIILLKMIIRLFHSRQL